MDLLAASHARTRREAWFNPWTWSARRLWLQGLLYLGLLGIGLQAIYVTLGTNFHVVVIGDLYRSGQPSLAKFEEWIPHYGLRTIINLRGDNTDDWYYEEHALERRFGVHVVDVGLWANSPPPRDQFLILVDTLYAAPPGILIHCASGGDRSGLASALAILLRTGSDFRQARGQLSLYYGHYPFGKAACQDRVLDRYSQWLDQNGWQHTPERLRDWAHMVYSPELCQ
jgi:hypothetical protein